MMNILSNKWLILTLRLILGGAFVYAGVTKLLDPAQFADSIASFRILPNSVINIAALGLPPFEIFVGLMMITGWNWRVGNLGILFLSVVFAIALAQGLFRGLEIDCGCFGSGKPSASKTWLSLGRDILIMCAALVTYRFACKSRMSVETAVLSPFPQSEIS